MRTICNAFKVVYTSMSLSKMFRRPTYSLIIIRVDKKCRFISNVYFITV